MPTQFMCVCACVINTGSVAIKVWSNYAVVQCSTHIHLSIQHRTTMLCAYHINTHTFYTILIYIHRVYKI